jgi:hypothetical protein
MVADPQLNFRILLLLTTGHSRVSSRAEERAWKENNDSKTYFQVFAQCRDNCTCISCRSPCFALDQAVHLSRLIRVYG